MIYLKIVMADSSFTYIHKYKSTMQKIKLRMFFSLTMLIFSGTSFENYDLLELELPFIDY